MSEGMIWGQEEAVPELGKLQTLLVSNSKIKIMKHINIKNIRITELNIFYL